jgi:uncharacterized protein (TIGR03067 family)
VAASASVLAAQTPPKSELDKLQGSWIVTAASGQDVAVGTVVNLRVDGNKYKSTTNGTVDESGTVSVSSTRKPATIDFAIAVGKDAGKTQLGLLEIVDDTATIALAEPGSTARPTAMTGALTLVRVKPLPKEFTGDWDGILEAAGAKMRLTIKLQNGADGLATGTMISVDQGNREAPIAAVLVRGMRVTVLMPAIRGAYDAQLKDGQLTGNWTQPGGTRPLVLKRKG